jgi:hypothetical protein
VGERKSFVNIKAGGTYRKNCSSNFVDHLHNITTSLYASISPLERNHMQQDLERGVGETTATEKHR